LLFKLGYLTLISVFNNIGNLIMARSKFKIRKVSKSSDQELVAWYSILFGIKCPICKRIQCPKKMLATNPYRGWNKTDFHMCSGCNNFLYLTGEKRTKQFYTITAPIFLGLFFTLSEIFSNIEGLKIYHEARGVYEPNFIGGLIITIIIVITIVSLHRFEKIGVASSNEVED